MTVSDAALNHFVSEIQAMADVDNRRAYGDNIEKYGFGTKIEIERNRRFARIVRVDNLTKDRSVHCFVELETGDIYKAGGWKAPAANGKRGNIAKGAASCCTANGTIYLR